MLNSTGSSDPTRPTLPASPLPSVLQNLPTTSLPPLTAPTLGLPQGNQLPLLLSLENLDRTVTQLRLLQGNIAGSLSVGPQLLPLPDIAVPRPALQDLWNKLLESIAPGKLAVIPLHQLATVEERSLAQAVRSLQADPRDGVRELLARLDTALDQVTTALRDTLGVEVLGLSRVGEVLHSRITLPLSEKAAQMASVLTSVLYSALQSGSNKTQLYTNRFLTQRARRQEIAKRKQQHPRISKPSLPEHILQILVRIVVRIFSF